MKRKLLYAVLMALLSSLWLRAAELRPTPGPAGPYRVSANRILDRVGRSYLIRGTELAAVTLDPVKPGDLGALSASALVTIRQRLNMNAVRLPFGAVEFQENAAYASRVAEIVRTANRLDLLVVLAPFPADEPSSFWTGLGRSFRDNPNVFFSAVSQSAVSQSAVTAIRAAGAQQPIVASAQSFPIDDENVIYQTDASYATARTESDLADRVPVLAVGLDPHLSEHSAECAAFPSDPAAATSMLQATLEYFDAHGISWMVSAFRPGQLITDTRTFTGTKLDNGWTCGEPPGAVGIGLAVLAHLWHSDPHGLFTVNGDAGNFYLARGGRATAYGPIMADRAMGLRPGQAPPTVLGNVSVRITDARGIARLAPLLYTGGGWAWLNFVVPDDVAAGPAEIAIVRTDGSLAHGRSIVADVAPGLRTASFDGRGPALGQVSQRMPDGSVRTFEASRCAGYDCGTVPIPLSSSVVTTVRLVGSGFRHADSKLDFQLTVGDVAVPVLSFGPLLGEPGTDQVTVRLTDDLIGYGETDLVMKVRGALSDVVRIACGAAR
jgi:uncharacterized protein (TIGR03437 family)